MAWSGWKAASAYLAINIDRIADYNCNVCNWDPNGEYITHTFQKILVAMIKWDFSEINRLSCSTDASYESSSGCITRYISLNWKPGSCRPQFLIVQLFLVKALHNQKRKHFTES